MNIFKASLVVAALSMSLNASAQFSVDGFAAAGWTSLGSRSVSGNIDGDGGFVLGALSAQITWGYNAGTDQFGVIVDNNGTGDPDGPLISSAIVGFYMSRPA